MMSQAVIRIWNRSERNRGRPTPRRLRPYLCQHGGGKDRRQRTYEVTLKKHPITILEATNEDATHDTEETLVLYGGHSTERQACFRLELFMDKKVAHLESLSMPSLESAPCWNDGYSDARLLVIAAFALVRRRGIRILDFTDNSTKHCDSKEDVRLRLCDFYRLMTGKTWYQSVLEEAGATRVYVIDPILPEAAFENDNKKAATVSWDEMAVDTVKEVEEIELPVIDTSAPGSAREVLKYLREKGMCRFLAVNLLGFLERSHIRSVFGTQWRCDIPPMRRLATTQKQKHPITNSV